MSSFLDSSEEGPRSAMVHHSLSARAPFTSARSSTEWTVDYTTSELLQPTFSAFAWPTGETHTHCLPLKQIHAFDPSYHYVPPTTTYSDVPFSWPFELSSASHPVIATSGDVESISLSGSCNPLSTILPRTTLEPLQTRSFTAESLYEASPSLSTFSTASEMSVTPSTGVHPEDYRCARQSPMIKLEDQRTSSVHMLSEAVTPEESLMGDSHLDIQPSTSVASRGPSPWISPCRASSNCEIPDVKIPAHSSRPASCKASCSGSDDDYLLEDKPKRGYTNADNAKYHCEQCGKMFQRSYNLKAHMTTHNPDRSHPHLCQHPGCEKHFVRRTDLVRHEQSVHVKARNYPCPRCNGAFARKDTLRRHVDDGCPRRPEVKKRVAKVSGRPRPRCTSAAGRPSTSPSPMSQLQAALAQLP